MDPRRRALLTTITLFSLLALPVTPARAAVFCVTNSDELDQAMQTASTNGQDDEIRIRTGTYPAPEFQAFVYDVDGSFDLKISGGWMPFGLSPCALTTAEPDATTLDGENLRPVMNIQAQSGDSGRVEIEELAIISALGSASGAGLRIYSLNGAYSGEVLIDGVQFTGNVGPSSGSALKIVGGNKVTVRNSLFAFNRSNSGNGIASASMGPDDRGVYFINNTFTFSDHDVDPVGPTAASALQIELTDNGQSESRAFVANNLFWANAANDIWISPQGTSYVYNNNFSQPYTGGDVNADNLSVDPQLVQLGVDFTPAAGSPMIDQGRPEPTPPIPFPTPFSLDWSHGTVDFYRQVVPRVHGQGVDIGAAESPFLPDAMFSDRFEQ